MKSFVNNQENITVHIQWPSISETKMRESWLPEKHISLIFFSNYFPNRKRRKCLLTSRVSISNVGLEVYPLYKTAIKYEYGVLGSMLPQLAIQIIGYQCKTWPKSVLFSDLLVNGRSDKRVGYWWCKLPVTLDLITVIQRIHLNTNILEFNFWGQ